MIKTVFMVAVCDENGRQMPEYQGPSLEMEAKIRAAATQQTEFNGTPVPVPALGIDSPPLSIYRERTNTP